MSFDAYDNPQDTRPSDTQFSDHEKLCLLSLCYDYALTAPSARSNSESPVDSVPSDVQQAKADVPTESAVADTAGVFGPSDGPHTRLDLRLNGDDAVQELPSEQGDANLIVQLVRAGQLQNADGSLTRTGQRAIASAIANTGLLQTYEARARQVQNTLNHCLRPSVSLQFNRGADQTDNSLTGSPRPSTITFNGQTFPAGFGPGR